MPSPLENVRVAIPENRYPEQLGQLLERYGATVISCPLVRETPLESAVNARRFIEICESEIIDYVVFFTGVGADFLFKAVNKPEALSRSKIVARGPKAVAALNRAGVRVDFVAEAATTEGIVQTLSKQDLKGKSVLVQLYGQENTELRSALEGLGARMIGLSLYEYRYASDETAIFGLVSKILSREVDAICFTSGPQIRFLMEAASGKGLGAELQDRLRNQVVVVSIGEVTARALTAAGAPPHVIPQEPRMGTMVKALAEFYERRRKCITPSS
jgi:uroporphyrinogen-III synthase